MDISIEHSTDPLITAAHRLEAATLGTVLGIWAHPDDEAYASAGLMARARAAGHRVVVATATKGELGTEDAAAWPAERMAALRDREMTESLTALDVREHHWLGYADGSLDRQPPQQGIDQLAALIGAVEPDTILTFGPEGMTGHTDHRAISAWVTAAWTATGRRARLLYCTVTDEFHREWGAVNDEVGLWFAGSTPPCHSSSELALAVRCDEELLDRKYRALTAHESQTAPLIALLGVDRYRRWWATESFVDAAHEGGGAGSGERAA